MTIHSAFQEGDRGPDRLCAWIDSEVAALVLLAVMVLGIITAAQRLRSETVTGIALFLGFHTSILSDTTAFTLIATSMLAGGALFFLVKNRWVIVPLSRLVAVYSSHIAWSGRADAFAPGQPASQRLLISIGFLMLYFAVFNLALLVRPHGLSVRTSLAFSLLNWLGFLVLGARELARYERPDMLLFLSLTALFLLVAAGGAALERAGLLVRVYLSTAVIAVALALYEQLTGEGLVLGWAVLGLVSVGGGRALGALPLRAVGVAVLGVAIGDSLWLGLRDVLVPRALTAAFIAAERLQKSPASAA